MKKTSTSSGMRPTNTTASTSGATSRHLLVRDGDRIIADTSAPLALHESGFAPRWYVRGEHVDESSLKLVEGQTFCPYKGLASYFDVGRRSKVAWSYANAWQEVIPVANCVSFEPAKVDVHLDGIQLRAESGQTVIAHGLDRGLDSEEVLQRR